MRAGVEVLTAHDLLDVVLEIEGFNLEVEIAQGEGCLAAFGKQLIRMSRGDDDVS